MVDAFIRRHVHPEGVRGISQDVEALVAVGMNVSGALAGPSTTNQSAPRGIEAGPASIEEEILRSG